MANFWRNIRDAVYQAIKGTNGHTQALGNLITGNIIERINIRSFNQFTGMPVGYAYAVE